MAAIRGFVTKLLDVAKPLELWCVDDFHQQWVEHKGSMDGVMKQLCGHDQGISMHLAMLVSPVYL